MNEFHIASLKKNTDPVFMKHQLVVLAKNPNTYFIERLVQEAEKNGVLILNPWTEKPSSPIKTPILVRTTSIHASNNDLDFIENNHLSTIPNLNALKTLRTKPSQFKYFENNGIAHLPWLDLTKASDKELTSFCSSPSQWLIKPHRGQGGWGIQVFEDVDAVRTWLMSTIDKEYLLQPYIEDHEEHRIFFIKNDLIALKRIKDGVAANFKQNGAAQIIDVSPELRKIVEQIRDDLGLIYGAADFLVTKKRAYILEMNLVPGIEQLEQVSGRNISKNLLEVFIQS